MEQENLHGPGEGQEKHSTQIISLFVGLILFVLGLAGILFSGFAGLHLSPAYSSIIAAAGALLVYNGYKNNSQDAFMCCLGFAIFFGLHAFIGWVFGSPGTPNVGFDRPDAYYIKIIPNFHELGRNDHILNTVLSIVLFGGAVDWWRRHTEKGHRKDAIKNIQDDYKERRRSHTNRPIHH
jgi:hypothetical protein